MLKNRKLRDQLEWKNLIVEVENLLDTILWARKVFEING